jgi:hypothetical protein
MTTSSLPISRLIAVTVNLSPLDAQAQDISTLLLLVDSPVVDVTERYRAYSTIAEVLTDFGSSSSAYKAAALWFEQIPQPVKLLIGRWAKTASKAKLIGAPLSASQQLISNWTGITSSKFSIIVDGGSAEDITVGSFAAVTNLNGVASIIQTGLATAHAGITCVWNSIYSRFEITGATTGDTSSLSFLDAPTTGTDISDNLKMLATDSGAYSVGGIEAETLVDCLGLFDDRFGQKWYSVVPLDTVDHEVILSAADYIGASGNRHILGITTQEDATLLINSSDDLASILKEAGYLRVTTQYSSSTPYAICSLLARILTTNYNSNNSVITLMYKQEPGITPETLSTTEIGTLNTKNCNVFVKYNNDTAIIEQGKVASGEFLDVVTGTDWLALTIQTALYNLLYTSTTKIPQTDAGVNILLATIEGILAQAVDNGLLAPGVWNSDGFGSLKRGDYVAKGYYVWAQKMAAQVTADRAARKAPPIKIAVKLAGAIHTVDVAINVNR